MKRSKILKVVLVAAFAMVAGYTAYSSQQVGTMSDIALENVEALAGGENGNPCGGPKVNDRCESRNTINCKDNYGCS